MGRTCTRHGKRVKHAKHTKRVKHAKHTRRAKRRTRRGGNDRSTVERLAITTENLDELTQHLSEYTSLKALICPSLLLTTLPPLPATLQVLICNDNQLEELPLLPDTLQWLECKGNPFEYDIYLKSIGEIRAWQQVNLRRGFMGVSMPNAPSTPTGVFNPFRQQPSTPTRQQPSTPTRQTPTRQTPTGRQPIAPIRIRRRPEMVAPDTPEQTTTRNRAQITQQDGMRSKYFIDMLSEGTDYVMHQTSTAAEFLASGEYDDPLVISVDGALFFTSKHAFEVGFDDNIRYMCVQALALNNGALDIDNIHLNWPLYALRSTGIMADFVFAFDVRKMLDGNGQLFVLEHFRDVPSVVSKAVLNDGELEGAAHCQEGQGGKLYYIRDAQPM
jgi:hypothetical protein